MGLVFPSHVLPRVFCLVSGDDELAILPALVAAGITGFQVRDKDATTRALIALTRRVRELVGDACLIVDDRVDVALAARADGVHLGADDLPVETARRLGPDLVIGATCRSRTNLEAARAAGADYAGFGPVRATTSKAALPAPLGVDAIADVVDTGLPIIAIGGIDAATAASARAAGAHGVAVIGSIWRHPDPVRAAKELVAAVG